MFLYISAVTEHCTVHGTDPYGKGYPRGKMMAAGRPPCGRATPQTALRPFGGWPARRAYKDQAGQAQLKL
jgi:hypothetical protein